MATNFWVKVGYGQYVFCSSLGSPVLGGLAGFCLDHSFCARWNLSSSQPSPAPRLLPKLSSAAFKLTFLCSYEELERFGPMGECEWDTASLQKMLAGGFAGRLFSWKKELEKNLVTSRDELPPECAKRVWVERR